MFTKIIFKIKFKKNCSFLGSIEDLISARDSEVIIFYVQIRNVSISFKNQIFDLEASKLNITELHLENVLINDYFQTSLAIINIINSFLYWNKVNIINSTFYANKFVNACNSSLLIENLNMINNTIESNFIFVNDNTPTISNTEIGENFIIFENCKIIGITSKFFLFCFLATVFPYKEISIKFSIFKNLKSFSKLVRIECFCFQFLMENVIFISNFVDSNMYITSSKFIKIFNVTFFNNNAIESDIYQLRGSCMILLDNIYLSLTKIKLIITVTLSSASIILTNHNLEGLINIDECIFLNNRLIIKDILDDNIENGGVINVYTYSHFFLKNSVFSNNILNIENSKIISAPCITIVSENIVLIDNSIFKKNRASKLSNCLCIFADALKITSSYFINNTISFISNEQFQIFNLTRTCETEFKVQESKGGSIYFSGNSLIIISSIFKDNKANVGSAIFIDDKNINTFSITIKIENCSFIRNQAIFTSTIGFELFTPFEVKIINSLFSSNFACNGGVLFLKLKNKATFNLENNFFFQNVANAGPVIFIDEGSVVFRNRKNIFMRNAPQAVLYQAGGTAYIVNSAFGVIFLENESYIENECYQGVISLFRGKGFEVNGIYIRNRGGFVSVLAMINLASYEGRNLMLLDNLSLEFGCIAVFDTCTIFLDNIIFKNCSSYHRASCLSLQISCKLTMNQGVFFLNSLNSANIIEFQLLEDQPVLNNCYFWKNYANSKLFDIISSSIYLNNSFFAENSGCIFSLSIAVGVLQNLIFKNSISKENLFSIYDNSILIITQSNFENQYLAESFFYSENSQIILNYINLLGNSGNSKGGTLNSFHSIISISNCNLTQIENNAFLSNNDVIFVDQINIFNNLSFIDNKISFYGVFVFKFPKLITIQGLSFFGNIEVLYGGFISIFNSENLIKLSECYFLAGRSIFSGGAIYAYDSSISIKKSVFSSNQAKSGASIFFDSLSNEGNF